MAHEHERHDHVLATVRDIGDALSSLPLLASDCMRGTRLVALTRDASGRALLEFRLVVRPEHANAAGVLFGGHVATICDHVTSMAVTADELLRSGGHARDHVTMNINFNCMSAAAVGDELRVVARADRVGGAVAFASMEAFDAATGALRYTATHVKRLLKSTRAPKL
mmetsp:Transcript_35368/g.86450  ORF Transcript_35368/g.86450 Transcript_35368/m.86450 type:complete len:167 (+) Transcript_35368:179-679(+)